MERGFVDPFAIAQNGGGGRTGKQREGSTGVGICEELPIRFASATFSAAQISE